MSKESLGAWVLGVCCVVLSGVPGFVSAEKSASSSKTSTPPPPPMIRAEKKATKRPNKRKARWLRRRMRRLRRRVRRTRRAGKHKNTYAFPKRVSRQVRRLGPSKYTITRAFKRYYLIRLSYVKLKVVVEPYVVRGRSIGYHLYYVSQRSPLRLLGLLEKDVILRVNKRSVRSEYEALLAYMALKKRRLYTVDILRKGKKRRLSIKVL